MSSVTAATAPGQPSVLSLKLRSVVNLIFCIFPAGAGSSGQQCAWWRPAHQDHMDTPFLLFYDLLLPNYPSIQVLVTKINKFVKTGIQAHILYYNTTFIFWFRFKDGLSSCLLYRTEQNEYFYLIIYIILSNINCSQ